MAEDRRTALEAPFAVGQVRQREGDDGVVLDYIEAHNVIQRLNDALAGDWSFEVTDYQVKEAFSEVIVLGRLTTGDGIVKCQFGSASLSRHRQTGEWVGLADALKASATDSLKKCATLLGVGLYLYNRDPPTEILEPGNDSGKEGAEFARSHQEKGPSRFSGHEGRLSAKQLKLIQTLCDEGSIATAELNRHCQSSYGSVVSLLNKADASHLIESLFAQELHASVGKAV